MTKRNLILLHRGPEYERDFGEIAEKVYARDEDITVYLLSGAAEELPSQIWQRPTLTVALSGKFRTQIKRGIVLSNRKISKLGQAKRAREGGIVVPPILPFTFGMKLDPIAFGSFVILKPMSINSKGLGVQLFRRNRVEKLGPKDFAPDHPIHRDREGYLVQKFIDTGEFPSWNRVISFFGRPIYAVHGTLLQPRPDLSSSDAILEAATVAIQGATRQREWRVEGDIMDMAKEVGRVFGEIPLLAIDILRDVHTRKLYFLECNPGGNTWHFSSNQAGGINLRLQLGEAEKHGEKRALELGRQRMIEQFDAFNAIAEVLVEKTHLLAV